MICIYFLLTFPVSHYSIMLLSDVQKSYTRVEDTLTRLIIVEFFPLSSQKRARLAFNIRHTDRWCR